MLIHLSSFIGMAVASLSEGAKVGEVKEAIIHPETGEMLGFLVKMPGFFGSQLALSARDVRDYDDKAILISSSSDLVDLGEIQPLQKFAKQSSNWIGKGVVSESGENLGAVENVVIDTNLDMVSKIYVGGFFRVKRIIDRDQIVKIENKKIIIKNNLELGRQKIAIKEAA